MVQSRRIICSVSGYGYYRSFLLEQLHKALFVCRTGTRHNFQIHYPVKCFFITQFCKSNTSDTIPVGVGFRLPKTYLTSNLGCSPRSVAGHNLDTDTCRLAFGYGGRNIRTNRVRDSNHSQEVQVVCRNKFHTIIRLILLYDFKGEAQCAHRHILVIQ